MFVASPYRATNGLTVVNTTARTFTANGFSTIGAALAANPSGTTTSAPQKAVTARSGMKNGVSGGVRKNTKYSSYHSLTTYLTPGYKKVTQYRWVPTPLFEVHYKELGIGYTGGSNTGLGNPYEQVKRSGTDGHASSVANRAVMINLENRAIVECTDKARNQKLDLSESFVDIDKTVLLIVRRISQVVKAWEKARQRDWVGVLRELGLKIEWHKTLLQRLKKASYTVSSSWLELSYAWIPLLSDIYAGVDAVNNGIKLPESIASVVRQISTPLPFIEWTGGVAPTYWWDYKIKNNFVHDVKCKFRFRVDNPTLAYLSAIGLDNPAYLIWVGTPFSFVIDWLLPVGTWLKSLTGPLGLTLVDGYMSKRTSGSIDIECNSWGNRNPGDIVWERPARLLLEAVELDRVIYTTWPARLPYLRLPFSNPNRIVSSIALLHQAGKR